MPRFLVHLDAPGDSEHFRETVLVADDADSAQAYCEGKEAEYVAFNLTTDDRQDLLDKQAQLQELGSNLSGKDKAALAIDAQIEPYTVTSVINLDQVEV